MAESSGAFSEGTALNDQDLRVVKTNENIENALFTLMRDKPLEKITVAELARVETDQ